MENAKINGTLSWTGILRIGLIQLALGSIVVLTTSTLNRVMVVELALPAMLPGALVGLHYAIQVLRPRWGYGSDVGGRRTPWIIGGMLVLAAGGVLAAYATALMASSPISGITLSVIAFIIIGCGVGASGTSLLVFMAVSVNKQRRAAAASIVWLMMIAGIAITAGIAGKMLDPFSFERLVLVTSTVCTLAVILTIASIWGLEQTSVTIPEERSEIINDGGFFAAIRTVWSEPKARKFSVFVFASMLAYSAQDLVLEPFAGAVFKMTPGESTQLSGVQHGGVFTGMVLVALLGSGVARGRFGSMRAWTVGGCLASAAAHCSLVVAGLIGPPFPLVPAVFLLGVANGTFAVAAIGAMMGLVRSGAGKREGTRMGLWGAAQALAFGLGGFIGTVILDVVRYLSGSPEMAFAAVFALEALLFVVSARLAFGVSEDLRNKALGSTSKPARGEPTVLMEKDA